MRISEVNVVIHFQIAEVTRRSDLLIKFFRLY